MLPGDFPTLANLVCSAGNSLALLLDDSSSSSDSSDHLRDRCINHFAFYYLMNPLEGHQRSCVACAHHVDMLGNNDSTSRDTTRHWNKFNAAAYDARQINELWMAEATFDERLVLM